MQKKTILFLIILIITLVLGAVAIYWWQGLVAEKNSQEKLLEVKERELTQLQKIGELISEKFTTEDKQKVYAVLPEELEFSEVLLEFENMASASGVTINSISMPEANQKSPSSTLSPKADSGAPKSVEVVSLAVQGEGTYEILKNFLGELEKNLPLMDVTSLQFSGGKEIFNFSLDVDTYVKK